MTFAALTVFIVALSADNISCLRVAQPGELFAISKVKFHLKLCSIELDDILPAYLYVNREIEFVCSFFVDVPLLHTSVIKVVHVNLSVECFGSSFLSCLLSLIKIE